MAEKDITKGFALVALLIVIGIVLGLVLSSVSLSLAKEQAERRGWRPPADKQLPTEFVLRYYTASIIITINIMLLIGLLGVYLQTYTATKSSFMLGLMFFLGVLLIQSILSLPLLHTLFGYTFFGLGPFGMGNPRPRLATGEVQLKGDPRTVGRGSQHLQFTVSDGQVMLKAIAFGGARFAQPLIDRRCCRLAFKPIINEFNGRRSVELQVEDIQFAGQT